MAWAASIGAVRAAATDVGIALVALDVWTLTTKRAHSFVATALRPITRGCGIAERRTGRRGTDIGFPSFGLPHRIVLCYEFPA
jgi:hypothetical protein